MKVYLYEGVYEMYITDKEMPYGYALLDEFDNVPDAEDYAEKFDDWVFLDRDLIAESSYHCCVGDDDYNDRTFDFAELTKCK